MATLTVCGSQSHVRGSVRPCQPKVRFCVDNHRAIDNSCAPFAMIMRCVLLRPPDAVTSMNDKNTSIADPAPPRHRSRLLGLLGVLIVLSALGYLGWYLS